MAARFLSFHVTIYLLWWPFFSSILCHKQKWTPCMLMVRCDLSALVQFGFSLVSLVGGLSLEVLFCFAQLASLNSLVPLYGAVFHMTKGEAEGEADDMLKRMNSFYSFWQELPCPYLFFAGFHQGVLVFCFCSYSV
ncbi:hypothetical protein SLEP1_g54287 [Rubroshorea leprosula]|uniref:Uncharacterized protein n=1 Tax=Rubroshorea leprosula TaxID=152421 RepID=A0AAV5MFY5_9ROSI|nr:hypothetical protein SLEP1_g54287 [Rubroshorea leprosula]